MLSSEALKAALQADGLNRTDKLLLCLAVDSPKRSQSPRFASSRGTPASGPQRVGTSPAFSRHPGEPCELPPGGSWGSRARKQCALCEAVRRNAKWKAAKTKDDLALMGEHEFLQVLEAISVVGKSVKHELEGCLKLRNGCGHPNSLKIGENRVSAHIETLILNVYSRFPA